VEAIPGPETKICSKCGEEKPLTEYYVKDKLKGRLFSWCKVCHVKTTSARIKANPEKHAEHARNAYWNDPDKANTRKKAWRENNLDKARAADKTYDDARKAAKAEWRKVNAERRKAYNVAYREANAEKVKAYNLAYYANNKEEVSARIKAAIAKNPEKYQVIHSSWKKANKNAVNSYTHKRRAKLAESGNYTPAEWEALKVSLDNRCLMCKRQEPEIKLTVDHIVPIVEGGSNEISNIQPLCKSCNSKKHRKTLDLRKG
jgi:hypothetical protein